MRFLMISLLTLMFALAVQSSAIAAVDVDQSCVAADDSGKDGKKKGEEEPECE